MKLPSREPTAKRPRYPWLAAGAIVLAAGGLITGAVAAFQANAVADGTVSTGHVSLDWQGQNPELFTIPVGPLRPGETSQHIVPLTNTGTVAMSRIQLQAQPVLSNALADPSNGLQLRIESCPVQWTGSPPGYTCPGTAAEITPDRPLTGRINVSGLTSTAIGKTDYLRFTFRLPDSSPSDAAATIGDVNFTVLGEQRPGQQR